MSPVEHKLIQGQGAGKWLAFARSKVATLHARARALGVDALSQRWVLEGGDVELAVRVVGDQRYIHIRRKGCPPFLSGLCDLVLHKVNDEFTPIYQVPNPDPPPPETVPTFRRFFPSLAQTEPARDWRDEPKLAVNITEDADAAKQMISLKSSKFSAEMRKVVQVLQGMGVFIPYSPTFAKTHGVFRASSGQRWIIELSNGGVVAWPMQMCRNPVLNSEGTEVLDYTPIATPKPEDIEAAKLAGAYVELAPASTVQEFYNKSSFYNDCGWAFDSTGHIAANVCFYNVGSEFQSTLESYLYQVDITEVDDRPTAAVLSRKSSGFMLGPLFGHMKYPNARHNGLASFTLNYRLPFDKHCEAPVYCYFDDDELKVVKYRYSPSTSGASSSNNVDEELCVDYANGGLFEQRDNVWTAAPGFMVGGGSAPPLLSYGNSIVHRVLRQPASLVGAGAIGLTGWRRAYQSTRQEVFNIAESLNLRTVFIVPLLDREAMYYALESRYTTSDHSVQSSVGYCSDPAARGVQLITQCTGAGDVTEVLLLGNTLPAPPHEPNCGADPGSGMSCVGPGLACNSSSPIVALYSGIDAGDQVILEEGPLCGGVAPPPGPIASRACFNVSGGSHINYRFEYIASGGGSRPLADPTLPDLLFQTVGLGGPQSMVSLRDAFDGRRGFVSGDISATEQQLLGLSAYPAPEVGAVAAFIGVP